MYDKAYQDEYERRATSKIGKRIYRERWRYVQEYVNHGVLLDYGCGAGAFHASAPSSFTAYGYDINPYSPFNTEIDEKIDVLTMWDVIEHLVVPTEPIEKYQPEWVILSTPNIDAAPDNIREFKHWKPGEHLHYFNLKSLQAVMACVGYDVVSHNFEEGAIRDPNKPEAIISIACRKS